VEGRREPESKVNKERRMKRESEGRSREIGEHLKGQSHEMDLAFNIMHCSGPG